MTVTRWWIGAVVVGWLSAGTSVPVQGALDADSFKTYGGTYMSDCGNNVAAKVTVFEDAIVLLDGSKRIAGSNVQAAASYYGQDTPPEYRTAILSDVPGQSQLIVVVSQDDAGYYVTLDGDAKLAAQIGKPLLGTKFRRCDPTAKPAKPAAAAPAHPGAPSSPDAAGMMMNPKFKAAYYKALGPKVKELWLAKLDGPSPLTRKVTVAGKEYTLVSSCKNHDCADNNTVLLYSPSLQLVYGKIYQRGRSTLIGAPPNAVARELERLWAAKWRQAR